MTIVIVAGRHGADAAPGSLAALSQALAAQDEQRSRDGRSDRLRRYGKAAILTHWISEDNLIGGTLAETRNAQGRVGSAEDETRPDGVPPGGSEPAEHLSIRDPVADARRAREADGAGARPVRGQAGPDLGARLHAFRSLGGNCEFGFVQRYGGAEPSGLLRFSYTPIADLIHALDTDFSAYGAPDDLEIKVNEGGAYYCGSRRYNIWSNTAHDVSSIDPAVLLERQYGRIAHLKRRMLEELAAGTKILVRKTDQGETPEAFDRLARAIARHGPSPLLLVSEVGETWRPGAEVRRLGERVYAGGVRRFAPTETAWTVDLEPWLVLCDRAYAVHHRLPETDRAAVPPAPVLPLQAGLRRHRGRPLASGLSAFTKAVDPAAFEPGRAYVFSAWVWIPPGCRASRIFAVTGQERLGWCDADVGVRGRWQHVWAAGRFRREADPAPVGLGMFGGEADGFWSWGARLHEGVVPGRAPPPALDPESARSRWLSSIYSRCESGLRALVRR